MDKTKESQKEPGNDYGFFVEDIKPADRDYDVIDAPEKDLALLQQLEPTTAASTLDTKDFIHGEGVKESQKETDFKPLKGIF
jgi:hypothetical protein